MKKVALLLIVFGAFIGSVLFCGKYDTNPFSNGYTGSYSLSTDLASLPDTLALFHTYSVNWTETGTDAISRRD